MSSFVSEFSNTIEIPDDLMEEIHADMMCRSRWLESILGLTDRLGLTHSIFSQIPTENLVSVSWQEIQGD